MNAYTTRSDVIGHYTALVGDIVNSTGIKETQPEPAWVTGTKFLYDTAENSLVDSVREHVWCKTVGDAIMWVCPATYTADLLNSAIDLLEAINDANRGQAGGIGTIDYNITIGVATGSLVELEFRDGRRDYIGQTADKAFRLSGIATPNALLADSATVAAGNMTILRSRVGRALDRPVEEYLSARESAPLKGFAHRVDYHEIQWAKQLFGVKSGNLTEAATRGERVVSPPPKTVPAAGQASEQRTGKVKMWNADRGFGFVTDPVTDEDFYLSPRALVYADDAGLIARPGAEVVFVVAPPLSEGKSRRGVCVLVAGQSAEGRISYIHPTKPFGFVAVVDDHGGKVSLHTPLPDEARARFTVGDEVAFDVTVSARGAQASNLEPVDEGDTSAA
ncbi:hypothetical protein [Nocardia sp. BMG111209]|uniref:hypothetical protein n=1 Tax=Nocardia sp. BMG111209 TaxID=1160137 RepID=UPI00037E5825|nr:hypothetical protein [Nocardia sp. BMG111209]